VLGRATALTLAGVLAFATGIAGLAAALALTRVFTLAAVLTFIAIVGQEALGGGAVLVSAGSGSGSVDARRRTRHQAGDGNSREHGFGRLEEMWIFHLNPFLFPDGVGCLTNFIPPGGRKWTLYLF